MTNIINDTIAYVKKYFESDYSGHDFYHTLRVYNLAKTIAKNENCDRELVELAALLHDVDDIKLVGRQDEKFRNTKAYLRKINYPEDKIVKICHIISQVSFKGKDTVMPDSIEGMIVQDADRLDAIGAIGISRAFAYGGSAKRAVHIPDERHKENMNSEEYYANKGTSINHFYEKLLHLKDLMNTETAKTMAEHRHRYMEEFLEEFYAEWDGVR